MASSYGFLYWHNKELLERVEIDDPVYSQNHVITDNGYTGPLPASGYYHEPEGGKPYLEVSGYTYPAIKFIGTPKDPTKAWRWAYHEGTIGSTTKYYYPKTSGPDKGAFLYTGGKNIWIEAQEYIPGSGGGTSEGKWYTARINQDRVTKYANGFDASVYMANKYEPYIYYLEFEAPTSGLAKFYTTPVTGCDSEGTPYGVSTYGYLTTYFLFSSPSNAINRETGRPLDEYIITRDEDFNGGTQTFGQFVDPSTGSIFGKQYSLSDFYFSCYVEAGEKYIIWVRGETGNEKYRTTNLHVEFSSGGLSAWSWTSSNGSASDDATNTAYKALVSKGKISDFSYLVWNDMCDKVMEVVTYIHDEWATYYGLTYPQTRMTSDDRVLTAARFNSLRYNIGSRYSTGIQEVKSGDIVEASKFLNLTDRLNEWIKKITNE